MIASDIMTHSAYAVAADAPLSHVVRLMNEHHVSGVPVVDAKGAVIGIVTEGDLLRRVETGTDDSKPSWFARVLMPGREAGKYVMTHSRRVRDVMTADVITVAEDAPLADIVGLMLKKHIKRLPIVREGRLVGIVSRSDLVRKLGDAMQEREVSADDATIRTALLAAIDAQDWARGMRIDVEVENAVVGLDGCFFDLRERDALEVLASNVAGVRRVENRVICIEPNTGMVMYDPAA